MNLLMAIVAGSWLYACACSVSSTVTSIGLGKAHKTALAMSAVGVIVQIAELYLNIL